MFWCYKSNFIQFKIWICTLKNNVITVAYDVNWSHENSSLNLKNVLERFFIGNKVKLNKNIDICILKICV